MMPIRFLTIVLIFMATATAGAAAGPVAGPWGYAQVVNLIESRKAENHPIKSAGELISLLPKELRSTFTFIFKTKTVLQDSSPLYPRALAFNGRLFYTFNGDPGQRGYNSMEFIEFDRQREKFNFREVDFPPEGSGREVQYSTSTPMKCLACHGADPKPIWNPYHVWNDVYGTDDDTPTGAEKTNYMDFRLNLARHPALRYNLLFFPKGSKSSPYMEENKPDDFRFRPNLMATESFNRENAYRLSRLLLSSPNGQILGPVALFLLANEAVLPSCGDQTPGFSALQGEIEDRLNDEILRLKLPQVGHSAFEQILALSGLDLADFSMAREKQDFFFSDGEQSQSELLAAALYEDLSAADPELRDSLSPSKAFLGDYEKSSPLYSYSDSLLEPLKKASPTGCAVMMVRAEKALQQFPRLTAVRPNANSFAGLLSEAEHKRADKDIPVSCVFCHDLSGVATAIPFDDTGRLRQALLANGGRMHDEILKRLSRVAPPSLAMPPSSQDFFPRLNDDELSNFESYLEKLTGNN